MATRSEGYIPKQELKRRLSAWAGFKWDSSMNTWIYPNGNIGDSPDFVDNLDSCFRWLLPHVKLIRIDYVASGISPKGEITEWQVGIVSYVNPKLNQVYGFARSPSEALCRAINNLISGRDGTDDIRVESDQ
jgi:hypothetical protein